MSSAMDYLSNKVECTVIPEKSETAYKKEYSKFIKWLEGQPATVVDERVMLAYLQEMSEQYKTSTMWAIHSKLQSMLRINKGVDIKSFAKVQAFMKALSQDDEVNKAYVFKEDDLRKFFTEAPDISYLFLKVVAICGIFGSCRRYELCDLRLYDIKEVGNKLLISIRPSKMAKARRFTVADSDGIPYAGLVKQYLSLRPQNVSTDRVFLRYDKGKCTNQVVGINTFGSCPLQIARYLKLDNPQNYTGHVFRRTSATIKANGDSTIDRIQEVDCKLPAVASVYVEECISDEKNVLNIIESAISENTTSMTSENSLDIIESGISGNTTSVTSGNSLNIIESGISGNTTSVTFKNSLDIIESAISEDTTSGTSNNSFSNIHINSITSELKNRGFNISNNTNCTFHIHLK